MLRSYLTIALRTLYRQKGYAFLNVFGLALGIAASLLILQYVAYERSYDAFHEDADSIYRIRFEVQRNNAQVTQAATTFPAVGLALKADFPEVEAVARATRRYGGGVVRYEDRAFREQEIFHVDPSFLTLFSFDLLAGDAATALQDPNTAVLSAAAARKYFGDTDPLGQRLVFGPDEEYVVTGVAESPAHSHFQFDFLFSYHTLAQLWEMDFDTAWSAMDFLTYVRLRPGTDPDRLETAFPAFIEQHYPRASEVHLALSLQPVRDIHLHSDPLFEVRANGDAGTVYALAAIALFILLLAWVNYINLATARAVKRAREIGVRKVVGARKRQLITQFLLESLLLNSLAGIVAIALIQFLLPPFSQLVGVPLDLEGVRSFWMVFLGVFIAGAFLAGLYPAFVLSSFQPSLVLKGTFANRQQGLLLRKGLVVFQFAASVVLLTGTLVVFQQIAFMQEQDLGVDIDQTLVIHAPGVVQNNADYTRQYEHFKETLLTNPNIRQAAVSSEVPGSQEYWLNSARRLEVPGDAGTSLYIIAADYDYLDTYEHEVLAGRVFSRDFPADAQRIVLNEAAVQTLGLDAPAAAIGQRLLVRQDTLTVAGVVANYHQQGLHQAYYPIGFRMVPEEYRYFSVKMETDALAETIDFIEQTYSVFFPSTPFTHTFLDHLFDQQYRAYRQFGQSFGLFALLAVVVACLGLFGLSAFAASQRTKEIGIRKVLGSSVSGILVLLCRYFIRLVLVGSLVAVPIAWLVMDQWLTGFAFRISLSPLPFVAAILCTFVIALISVGYQSLKAALTDPVQALRYE